MVAYMSEKNKFPFWVFGLALILTSANIHLINSIDKYPMPMMEQISLLIIWCGIILIIRAIGIFITKLINSDD